MMCNKNEGTEKMSYTEKSKILVFNSRKGSPCIYCNGTKLEVVDDFKYLGMRYEIFNRDNKTSHADTQ
jgi:hypothetical protein